jgi:hypothetical protein
MQQLLEQFGNDKMPLMAFYLQPYPQMYGLSTEEEETAVYDTFSQMNVTPYGIPLFMGGRTAKPPTSCSTPGHTIKSGYTPSGKWRTSKYVPSKTDKRAGK